MGAGAIARDARRPRHEYSSQRAHHARRFIPRDLPRVVGRAALITSVHQLEELRRASRYPKFRAALQPHRVVKLVNDLHQAVVLDRLPPADNESDPFDAFLLGMIVAGEVDWLVTGDRRAGLLALKRYCGARIATPQEFAGGATRLTLYP